MDEHAADEASPTSSRRRRRPSKVIGVDIVCEFAFDADDRAIVALQHEVDLAAVAVSPMKGSSDGRVPGHLFEYFVHDEGLEEVAEHGLRTVEPINANTE